MSFFDESVYPFCRDIARQVRKDIPVVHGWCWSSVHDSEATAIMFFEVRIGETDLELKGMRFVNDDPSLLEELRQTASRAGGLDFQIIALGTFGANLSLIPTD